VEDNEHIWLCPESKEVHSEIWEDGLGRIDFWGTIATRRYNKERKKRSNEGKTSPRRLSG
jgi:hypothetical protein